MALTANDKDQRAPGRKERNSGGVQLSLQSKPIKPAIEAHIRELKAEGMGILKIGRTVGVGTSVVQRVLGQ
jgi:hypothetical protein